MDNDDKIDKPIDNGIKENTNLPSPNAENVVENDIDNQETKQYIVSKVEIKTTNSSIMTVKDWLKAIGWNSNPFTFHILPSILVGYKEQTSRLIMLIEERHKFCLVLGPTGSGKTTLLRWVMDNLENCEIMYLGKPPSKPVEFIDIFSEKFKPSWFARFFTEKLKTIYQVPDFLNSKLKNKHLVLLFDEAHEANIEILEWMRVLNDQVNNMTVIMSGLPIFEDRLRDNLETFRKRAADRIDILSLTKEETREMIRKRIQYVGGNGNEFDNVIDLVYMQTSGFPREVLRFCDSLVNKAIMTGRTTFVPDMISKEEIREAPVQTFKMDMTPMQKEILELLSKRPLSPGDIANSLDLAKYKSRQHAVRSVNNIVKKLFEDKLLDRTKSDKAYIYSLGPQLKTIFVKA